MKSLIETIAKNMYQINLAGLTVLLSYETPVAYYDEEIHLLYTTDKRHSASTTRHINKWVNILEDKGKEILMESSIEQSDLNLLYKNIGLTKTQMHFQSLKTTERFEDLIIDK